MKSEEFDALWKEYRRMIEQCKRDKVQLLDALKELSKRIKSVPEREFTGIQVGKIIDLVVKGPARAMGETTYWVHWESGEIECAGRNLDEVKEYAIKRSRETGRRFFIT